MANAGMQRSNGTPKAGGGWWKFAVSLALSAALLAFLIGRADGAAIADNWERFSPRHALLAVALFVANLTLRGLRLRRLFLDSGAPRDRGRWIRVSAAHQVMFSVMPSGLGDAGFPIIASRLAGCSVAAATSVLLTYRLQDLWMILMLAGSGLLLQTAGGGLVYFLIAFGLPAVTALLVWSGDLTRLLGSALLRLTARGESIRWTGLRKVIAGPLQLLAAELVRPTDWRLRLHGAWMTLLTWSLSTASLWSLFAMIGVHIGIAEVLLVIAGMNLVGALAAFTVAGLGVGEGGLAAMLLALGFGTTQALAVALIVRPAMVANILVGCGLIEGSFRLLRRMGSSPRPKGETGRHRA